MPTAKKKAQVRRKGLFDEILQQYAGASIYDLAGYLADFIAQEVTEGGAESEQEISDAIDEFKEVVLQQVQPALATGDEEEPGAEEEAGEEENPEEVEKALKRVKRFLTKPRAKGKKIARRALLRRMMNDDNIQMEYPDFAGDDVPDPDVAVKTIHKCVKALAYHMGMDLDSDNDGTPDATDPDPFDESQKALKKSKGVKRLPAPATKAAPVVVVPDEMQQLKDTIAQRDAQLEKLLEIVERMPAPRAV